MRFRLQSRGFTLIELLVVIAIIGILSSVVLASLNTARTKSRDARRLTDIEQLRTALEFYADANSGKYPALLSALPTGNYIPSVPKDPSNNVCATGYAAGDYCYAGISTDSDAATCESYHLGAQLEDTTVNANALASDKDANSSSSGTLTRCTGTGSGFNGGPSPDNIYDVRP